MADEKSVSANMQIYERFRKVPENAKEPIKGGKLNGFTDISPMWRIKCLTEAFGPAGVGWYTEITKQWLETGPDGKTAAFCNINLYIRDKGSGEWSKPIFGTGGSTFVNIFKGKQETSDEAHKMAYTDAMGVACKALGFGADVYWDKDRTKYSDTGEAAATAPRGNTGSSNRPALANSGTASVDHAGTSNAAKGKNENQLNDEMAAAASAAVIDAPKVAVIKRVIAEVGCSPKSVLDRYKVKQFEDMTFGQWGSAMRILNNMKARIGGAAS